MKTIHHSEIEIGDQITTAWGSTFVVRAIHRRYLNGRPDYTEFRTDYYTAIDARDVNYVRRVAATARVTR